MQILGIPAVSEKAQALAQMQAQAQTQSPAGSGSGTANSVGSLTSEQTFLQLLVAQIKNQDPLNPTDSIQFVGQLVQYSELEQLIGINQGVATLTGGSAPTNSTNQTSKTTQPAS
ncbi:MAG TPA: flagellar hook capping FlgD N-terminal domain-containing protein [Bryobacteraceae bacterium]|jgi:flagellar basal-body rod modification protein FlgD|nr:flagellar hook capping FlgD N-terminal domain-containing protein [Bryobacteraceae bacterium]